MDGYTTKKDDKRSSQNCRMRYLGTQFECSKDVYLKKEGKSNVLLHFYCRKKKTGAFALRKHVPYGRMHHGANPYDMIG